jgi:hypothetical protein
MAIVNTTVTGSNTTIYTSTGNNAITTIIVCNSSAFNPSSPSSNTSLLYMYAVPSGGTAGTGNIIVNGLPVPAGETVSFDQEKMVLADGDFIVAKTDSASNLVATVSTLAV